MDIRVILGQKDGRVAISAYDNPAAFAMAEKGHSPLFTDRFSLAERSMP